MALLRQRLLLLSLLYLLLQLWCLECEARPKNKGEGEGDSPGNANEPDDDDDSSSEETVEDSTELRRRRRDISGNQAPGGRAGIPGLPDPATIIKIAQIFQSVGEQLVPILLEAVLPIGDPTADRFTRDAKLQLLRNAKRSLELYSDELESN